MKILTIFFLILMISSTVLSSDTVLVIKGNPDVYKYEPDISGCPAHIDGSVITEFTGVVVEEVEGKEAPLDNVKFSFEIGDCSSSRKTIFLSNSKGQFYAWPCVDASIVIGDEKTKGGICFTDRSMLRIEKEGYKTVFLWVDYKMPEVKIYMEKGNTQPKTTPENQGGAALAD